MSDAEQKQHLLTSGNHGTDRESALAELQAEIQKGFDSGAGENLDVEEFIKRVKARCKNK